MIQMLVSDGIKFGGRPADYRVSHVLKSGGIVFNVEPDSQWRTMRKIAHRQLKQFGDGFFRIENAVNDVAEDMFEEFGKQVGKPFDPSSVSFDTALKSVAFLITGERLYTDDPLLKKMREYEHIFICMYMNQKGYTEVGNNSASLSCRMTLFSILASHANTLAHKYNSLQTNNTCQQISNTAN